MDKTLSVAAIKEGTVIDHIPVGQAFKIIRLLNLMAPKNQITVGLNLPSKRLKLKDLIKIEDRHFSEKEISDIAVFAPGASINIIHNFKVQKKMTAHLPSEIKHLLLCPNPVCITHAEVLETSFVVEDIKNHIYLKCKYCEKLFRRDQMREHFND